MLIRCPIRGRFAAADIDPAMLFVQTEKSGIGVFGNEAHLEIFVAQQLIGGQGLGPGIDNHLTRDDV